MPARSADAAWLDDATRERLRAAGREWGLNVLEVDAVIRKHMILNRKSQESEKRWIKLAVGAVGIAVVLLLCLLAWQFVLKPDDPVEPADDSTDVVADGAPVAPPPRPPAKLIEPAEWWDLSLLKAQTRARTEFPNYEDIYAGLASSDPAQRSASYLQLVAVGREIWNDKYQLSLLQEIIVASHELEPDEEAAQALRNALLSWTKFRRRNPAQKLARLRIKRCGPCVRPCKRCGASVWSPPAPTKRRPTWADFWGP